MSNIADNVNKIRDSVAKAASDAGRKPSDIDIMAATKYTDRQGVVDLLQAGIHLIGENRVQDALRKLAEMEGPAQEDIHDKYPECRVHLIGQLQTNKINSALRLFDMIESVDRISLATDLEKRLDQVLPILVEVKLTGEETKSGCPVDQLPELMSHIWGNCPHLEVRGFMGMGPWDPDPEVARPFYRSLKGLFDETRSKAPAPETFHVLSMGMSADFHVAIQEGATLVRIGRSFFE
jgi:PLP dependent protein